MQIQYELLKHISEYLKAIYETRGKQRIHAKSLLTISRHGCSDDRATWCFLHLENSHTKETGKLLSNLESVKPLRRLISVLELRLHLTPKRRPVLDTGISLRTTLSVWVKILPFHSAYP